jgi:Cu/Ag efflux protein CusF
MRRFATPLAVCVLLIFALTAFAQQAPAPGERGGPPAQQNPPQATDKNYTGTLSKVDLTAKEITVKGSDNKEMVFTFTDTTQMSGFENSQGLSGKTGSNLKITYRENRGANVASKIEVEQPQQR